MARIASVRDAGQLGVLNDEFHEKGETAIANNKQGIIIVEEENSVLVGFVCVQLKKLFCYDEFMPKITEVYVTQPIEKRGSQVK